MHDELWAAVQLKLDNAEFHLAQMRRSIQGPERTGHTMEAAAADAERTEQRHAHATRHLISFGGLTNHPHSISARLALPLEKRGEGYAHISSGDDLHRALRRSACHGAGLLGSWQGLRGTMPWGCGIDRYSEPSSGNPRARVQACINRCKIAPCQPTPLTARLCDATAQSICNNGFRACNDACVPSTATTTAQIQSQASCATFCCTQFKQCLSQRQCDISTITVINCSENPGAAPVSGAAATSP
jgi:hypothetical protein